MPSPSLYVFAEALGLFGDCFNENLLDLVEIY